MNIGLLCIFTVSGIVAMEITHAHGMIDDSDLEKLNQDLETDGFYYNVQQKNIDLISIDKICVIIKRKKIKKIGCKNSEEASFW